MYQPPFQQPAWGQPPCGQVPGYSGPPPAKKPRGNPIITKYPPPPGYKGPAQPQAPPQTPSWQPPHQTYGYGQPGYQGYPQPTYGVPHHQPQYPSTGYQQPPGYYPPPTQAYPGAHTGWQPPVSTPYQAPYQAPYIAPHSAPTSAPPQPFQPPPSGPPERSRHNSAPFPHARSFSNAALDGNGDPFPAHFSAGDDEEDVWQSDFESDCYFGRHPDQINPELSLGTVTWQPALPVRRPLPSTTKEAELEEIAPRPEKPAEEPSISDYFIISKREEALLSIRQTDLWQDVKGDVIFSEFEPVPGELIQMSQVLDKYRDRPDPKWTASERQQSVTPTPEPSRQPTPASAAQHGPTNLALTEGSRKRSAEQSTDALDNLEQALFSGGGPNSHTQTAGAQRPNTHSRANSMASQTSQFGDKLTRPRPLPPVRDQAQEDILAALGVTGSPKVVFQTPGPAFGPPPVQNGNAPAPTSRHNSMSSKHGGSQIPFDRRRPSTENTNGIDCSHANGGHNDRPGSAASQHTTAGSDFQTDDPDATPRPKFERADSRKRRFDEDGDVEPGDRRIDPDDATPKQFRKQQRVTPAYSRRW